MKIKNIISTVIFGVLILSISLTCWFKPAQAVSDAERRPLAQMPEFSLQSVLGGQFMSSFEEYAADQFPERDKFRTLKALFNYKVLGKLDNNGLFFAEDHLSKIEYPVNPEMVDNAAEKFNFLYEKFIKDKGGKVYLSLVPDKNLFLAEKNGYLAIDYEKFTEDFREKVPYMTYIDIMSLLSLDDYYRTDSHWKQEKITSVAYNLAKAMEAEINAKYQVVNTEAPFYGVYSGQAALPVKPDELKYLTNHILENMTVTYYTDTGKKEQGPIYDLEKVSGKDPYEMFLGGTKWLVEIENSFASTDKELVIFRDSFGSSIAPLIAQGYKKVSVVDIRYIQSDFVGNFVDFENKDVLFLYSTTLINNSSAMK